MTVLGWFELPERDQPPEAIWLDPEALEEHFQRVKDRYAAGTSSEDEHVSLSQNELTRGLRG